MIYMFCTIVDSPVFKLLDICWEKIYKDSIENEELITEDNRKRISSTLGWGTLGLLSLGPVAGIAQG